MVFSDFFFQAEDGIRDLVRSRGLGDVYKRQMQNDWYKDAVFYEVFVRAFADGNGDGIGDLAGLTARLDYLQALGVDALWMLPIFPSPLRDDGYDVADYSAIHPDYGLSLIHI